MQTPGDPHRPAQYLTTWAALLRTHAAVTGRLERDLQDTCGLALPWYEVLLRLTQEDGELRMQELAHSVLLSKSGLTRLVDRMEQAGLVARRSCPSDRRGTFVHLTDAGRDAYDQAAPVHLRGIREHFAAHLGPNDLDALRRALDLVLLGTPEAPENSCTADRAHDTSSTASS